MALTVGTEVEIEIHDVAFGGRGVGRHDGCAVFVPGTLAGERVRVRLTKCRKKFAEALLLEVLTASEHRIEPACALCDRCPGCSYQHVAYPEEVRIKQQQFEGLLSRIGRLEGVTFSEPIASPCDLGYRNKLVLHAQRERKLGYFGEDNRTVVDIPSCLLAVGPINDELQKLRANVKTLKNMRPNARVTFRWTETNGAVRWTDRESGVERLIENSPIGDVRVPRRAFYQVNVGAGDLLVSYISELIKQQAPTYLIDFYCGVGLFSLAAAQHGVPHVFGIERQSFAVRAAIQNAKAMKIRPEFVSADVDALAEDSLKQVDGSETMVIVDPPRQGLEKAFLETLISARPQCVAYVSCAADTLARDLRVLTESAYEVVNCQLIDMFPRTPHFESVTVLKSRAEIGKAES
ncbi:MAG: class I SAM-dependent RNA methyltransferase [Verrucomicrobia bacterium]|nr:class I SAM-dependent RNA methyltransferase [Verrucomicrobiota bacterium]